MPFLAFDVSSSGEVGYCCEARPIGKAEGAIEPTEILNGQEMSHIRQLIRSNAIPLGCQSCARSEKDYGTSKRLREIERYNKNEYGPPLPQRTNSELSPQLRFLNFRVGNRCNLKCLMCDPQSSHSIAIEEAGAAGLKENFLIENELHLHHSTENLRTIYFGGGEPFLSKSFEKNLLYLLDKNPQQIDVMLNTNLTLLPVSILEILKNFKSVYFGVSVDGFEGAFEYIRFPHRWSQLTKNLNTLYHFEEFDVSLHFTLSCLNLASVVPLAQYLLAYPRISLRIEPLSEPALQRVSNLSASALQHYKLKISDFLSHQEQVLNKTSLHSFRQLVSYLDKIDSSKAPGYSQQLIEFLNSKDKLRGTQFAVSLPNLRADLKSPSH